MISLWLEVMARFPAVAYLMRLVGAGVFCVGLWHLKTDLHIQETGLTAFAKVTRIQDADVEYIFEAQGKSYTGQGEIGAKDKAKALAGELLPVKYLPEDPAQNTADSNNPGPFGYIFGGIVCMLLPSALRGKRKNRNRA